VSTRRCGRAKALAGPTLPRRSQSRREQRLAFWGWLLLQATAIGQSPGSSTGGETHRIEPSPTAWRASGLPHQGWVPIHGACPRSHRSVRAYGHAVMVVVVGASGCPTRRLRVDGEPNVWSGVSAAASGGAPSQSGSRRAGLRPTFGTDMGSVGAGWLQAFSDLCGPKPSGQATLYMAGW
jgi:hypothetical protein